MTRKRTILAALAAAILFFAASAPAAELKLFESFSPDQPPVDVAVSRTGKWVYVLSESGTISVYTPAGEFIDKVSVGAGVDRIAAGLRDDLLYVSSKKDGTVRMVEVELVHDIPIADAPYRGPADAPVTIVVFTDFQCPYCAKAAERLDEVLSAHPKTVKLVYKCFPLRIHRYARQAAAAALAAARHGKFWEFHDRLFAEYKEITPKKIMEIAASLGFPKKKFAQEMEDPKIAAHILKDRQDGRRAGVMGTPTIFINGRLLRQGTMEAINEAIARELARSGAAGS